MLHEVERSSEMGPLSLRPFCLGCIIATRGCDFWEGQPFALHDARGCSPWARESNPRHDWPNLWSTQRADREASLKPIRIRPKSHSRWKRLIGSIRRECIDHESRQDELRPHRHAPKKGELGQLP